METTALKFIAIDGPIGVGKTTLVKRLAEELRGTTLLEPEEQNPFLPEFYKDRKKNAFKTQIFFLLSRYQQLQEFSKKEGILTPVLADYTFAKDQIFAKINLSPEEQRLYQQVFDLLHPHVPKADIVVYLRAKTEILLERIHLRGFDYEKPINEKYLSHLMDAYNEFFLNYTEAPLLVVDASHTNFLTMNDQYELLKKEILGHRKGAKNLVLR